MIRIRIRIRICSPYFISITEGGREGEREGGKEGQRSYKRCLIAPTKIFKTTICYSKTQESCG
jgi:hypothetical protein